MFREYIGYVHQARLAAATGEIDLDELHRQLCADADWTPDAADTLIALASEYGAFFLANALNLARAMGVEDGSRGY